MEPRPHLFTEEQREEIKDVVYEAMTDFFRDKGKLGRNVILTTATIFGSLLVIFGGIKAVLGWLGFAYISK